MTESFNMDWEGYAIYCGYVSKKEDIQSFCYACYVGINAIKKLFEHKNKQICPHLMPHRRALVAPSVLQAISNHDYDGTNIDQIINESVESIGGRKQLSDEIASLVKTGNYLDDTGNYTLPKYEPSKNVPPMNLIVNLSFKLGGKPVKRTDVEKLIKEDDSMRQYSADDVITGLVENNFL